MVEFADGAVWPAPPSIQSPSETGAALTPGRGNATKRGSLVDDLTLGPLPAFFVQTITSLLVLGETVERGSCPKALLWRGRTSHQDGSSGDAWHAVRFDARQRLPSWAAQLKISPRSHHPQCTGKRKGIAYVTFLAYRG